VPLAPGVTSALGTLFVDIVHDVARSHISPLSQLDHATVETSFAELEAEADGALARDRVPTGRRALQRSVDLRYVGQLKTLSIPVPAEPFSPAVAVAARERFLREYERRYHHVTEEIDVEISVVRVRGRGLQDKPRLPEPASGGAAVPRGRRPVRFQAGEAETAVYVRTGLSPGNELAGPAVVEQLDSTTVVPPGWSVRVDVQGNLRLESR
jgi:N-methylhydantoinase A